MWCENILNTIMSHSPTLHSLTYSQYDQNVLRPNIILLFDHGYSVHKKVVTIWSNRYNDTKVSSESFEFPLSY